MAERKSGPVKPPVIDLKARDATQEVQAREAAKAAETPEPVDAAIEASRPLETPKPAAKAAPKPRPKAEPVEKPAEPVAEPPRAVPPPPPPVRPQARLAMPWSAISIAAVAGALLGTGLTYGLVNLVPMPSNAPVIADPTDELASQSQRLVTLEDRLPALEQGALDTEARLDNASTQLESGLAEVKTSIAALQKTIEDVRTSIPTPTEVDLTALTQQLETLDSRVTAIAAGASSADAAVLADSLTGIEASVATLTQRLDAADGKLNTIDPELSRLSTELEAAKTAIAAQNQTLGGANIGPAIKLPLVVSGLETAFSAGRPFAAELESLTAILPDITVPPLVSAASETGLTRPDTLVAEFNKIVPDILAGRAAGSKGDWTQDAIEWAKALLALRPSEELEGDTPEAIVSRLEAAMERRDFLAAATLLDQLPDAMQSASGKIGDDIRTHAAADGFVAGLRAQALAPVTEPTT
jgi:hypothetical protein